MSGQPKFCVDCRHYDPGPSNSGLDRCRHPASLVPGAAIDLVTGKPGEPTYQWPVTMRRNRNPCGPEAKLFEPKPTVGFV